MTTTCAIAPTSPCSLLTRLCPTGPVPLRTIPVEPCRHRPSLLSRLGTLFSVLHALYRLAGQPALLPSDHVAPTHAPGAPVCAPTSP